MADPSLESDSDDDPMHEQQTVDQEITAREQFQNSLPIVTSKDTISVGGLNLANKRAKPNNAGPLTSATKLQEVSATRKKTEKNRQHKKRERRKLPMQPAKN